MAEQDGRDSVPDDRQIAREVITARVQERLREQALREAAERREARESRAQRRRGERLQEARGRKSARLESANKANERVRRHVASAATSLRAALRDAASVSLPRHSPEGRAQQKTMRSLEDAIRALRRVGAGRFDAEEIEVDLDLDLV